MKALVRGFGLGIVGLCGLVGTEVRAGNLTIDIHEGVFEPIPLMIPAVEGDGLFAQIVQVIGDDLGHSGSFRVTRPRGPQGVQDVFQQPDLQTWRMKAGSYLLGVVPLESSEPGVAVRLYDLDVQKMILEERIQGASESWRRIAHKIADRVYERVTGEPGFFDTRVAYTAQYGKPTSPTMRIGIMDYDGANNHFLTEEGNLALTPRLSPQGDQITYMAYHKRRLMNHIVNLATGEHSVFRIPGVGLSPRFSPDGTKLFFCSAKKGTTTIFSYGIAAKKMQRLTQANTSIDVSPSFSPDGRYMVFSSDRAGGRPKLYVMPASGGGGAPRLLSSGTGSYYMPAWSPDGKFIAFVKRQGDGYYLGIMKADGSGERLLVSDHVIDCPSWAPSGGHIIFSAQQGFFKPFFLFRVDKSGHCLTKIPTPHGANHPSWSIPLR